MNGLSNCKQNCGQSAPKIIASLPKIAWVQLWSASLFLACIYPALLSAQIESHPLASGKTKEAAETLFEKVSSKDSGILFEMKLPSVAQNFRELLQLATLGGIATGDVNQDGLADIFISSPLGGSRLFQNLGDFKFKDITETSHLNQGGFWATGANFIDINNDHQLDLYVCGYRMANRLYINEGADADGNVQFSEQANKFGLDYRGGSMQMYFADMDRDGDLDAYLATTAIPPPAGVKFQVRFEGKKPIVPEELREYWGLIYLPGEKAHPSENGQYDHLFRNDGNRFVEITHEAGINGPHLTLGAIWWDFNHDLWPDLYVANDYLGPDMLYLNQQDGSFKDVIIDQIPHTPWSSMGVDIGDLNNDGWMDLIACDMMGSSHYRRQVMMGESSRKAWFLDFAEPRQYSRNAVYLNTGSSRFMEIANLTNMAATDWTWAPHIEDFDLDGRVDVLFTNGMLRDVQHSDLANYADRTFGGGSPEWASWWSEQGIRKESNFAFKNLGDLNFTDVSNQWGLNHPGVSFGAATADFDLDGDLDLVINNADGPMTLFRNRSSSGNSFSVLLEGTQSNKFGIGATITLESGGLKQTRQVVAGRSWLSGSEPVSHFGLGSSTTIEKLTINWPSGIQQILTNLNVNQRATIQEPTTNPNAPPAKFTTASNAWFTEDKTIYPMNHQTQEFDDFTLQPLLPMRPSKTHYAMIWEDIDKDGDQDCFIGGGLGHVGKIYFSQGDGSFQEYKLPTNQGTQTCFDSDAHWVDIDQDDDLDLVIAKCSPMPNAPANVSGIELHLNDGKGNFTQSNTNIFPTVLAYVTILAITDIDGDNDLDIYAGGGPLPGKYPLGNRGYLLINEGGNWVDGTPDSLKQPWMVNGAVWTDIDKDHSPELLVATDWGNIQCIQFHKQKWENITKQTGILNLAGWWNCITACDVDDDGDTDFVVGNRGWNSNYHPTETEPDWLIFGDMDGNARGEIIEIYTENGTLYPRRGFDSLSRSMPFLRDKFINFHQFSTTDFTSMFPKDAIQKAYKKKVTTSTSGVLINLGNGKLEFSPLPRLAQSAPIQDIIASDFNHDGTIDLLVTQNDYSPQNMHGRMDGGISMILKGNGDGTFEPVPAIDSGIAVEGDVRQAALIDLNGDHKEDIVFGIPEDSLRIFNRQ